MLNKRLRNEGWVKLSLLLCLFCGIITVCLVFVGGATFFHSDSASVNLLIRERVQSGAFFPPEWYYTNGNIPLIWLETFMMPLMNIVTDQVMLRSISVFMWLILFAVCVIWMHKSVFQNNGWLLSLPLLFCGISMQYLDMFVFQAAYTLTVLLLVLGLTLFTKGINADCSIANRGYFIGFCFFLLYAAAHGMRLVAYVSLPFIAAVVLYYIIEHFYDGLDKVKATIKSPLLLIGLLVILTIGGLVMYYVILGRTRMSAGASTPNYISINSIADLQNNLFVLMQSLATWCGFEQEVPFYSFRGILNVLKLCMGAAIWFIGPVLYLKDYFQLTFQRKLVGLFFLVHTAINLYMMIFCRGLLTNTGDGRYLFTTQVLAMILLADVCLRYFIKTACLARCLVMLCMTVGVLSSGIIATYTYCKPQAVTAQYDLPKFLVEQGLHYGYASFWNAGKNQVLSNHEVEIVSVLIAPDGILPYRWLSAEHWYDPHNYTGETFLMLTQEESAQFNDENRTKCFGPPSRVLEYQNFYIYVYPYNIAEVAWLPSTFEDDTPLLPKMKMNGDGVLTSNEAQLSPGGILFGPYIDLQPGNYQLTLDCTLPSESDVLSLNITARQGQAQMQTVSIHNGSNVIPIKLDVAWPAVEFVVRNPFATEITIRNLNFKWIVAVP